MTAFDRRFPARSAGSAGAASKPQQQKRVRLDDAQLDHVAKRIVDMIADSLDKSPVADEHKAAIYARVAAYMSSIVKVALSDEMWKPEVTN